MKSYKLTLLLLLSIIVISTGCGKKTSLMSEEDAKFSILSLRSSDISLPVINFQKRANKNSETFQIFSKAESSDLKEYDLTNKDMFEYKFDNLSNFSGLYIELEKSEYIQKDILFVVDKSTNQNIGLLREILGFNNSKNGTIIFKNLNGQILIKHQYINGKLINKENINQAKSSDYEIGTMFVQDEISDADAWKCNRQQFNAAYLKAKNECENDWMCDFACSFNPCALSYLAAAIIECSKK